MEFHAALAKALADNGVDTMFGVLGDANLFFAHSFVAIEQGRYLSASNEGGAVLMAQGFGCVTGRLGVATVTHGAVSNTVTALCDAARRRQPVLVVAGDTAQRDKHNIQNLPHRDLVLPTGAGFEQVRSPETLAEDVASAIRRAHAERRPILLNVPTDYMWLEVDYQPVIASPVRVPAVVPADEELDQALGLLASASRPLVLAGGGAASRPARTALLRLAELLGAPVATSVKGKDLFAGAEANIGFFGNLATPAASEVISRADLVIAFGAGLNPMTTDQGGLVRDKRVVHVDLFGDRLGAITPVDCALVGDVAATAARMAELLEEAEVRPREFAAVAAGLMAAEAPEPPLTGLAPGTVDIRTALRTVEAAVPQARTLTLDGGRFWFESVKNIRVESPRDYVHSLDIGSVGLGVALAIGAGVGRPDVPALLVAGDGSFMLNGLQEFNTAVRHGVDLIAVILNDDAYGAEHVQMRDAGLDPTITTFGWPDLAPIAEALGGQGYTVRSDADLAGLKEVINTRRAPLLIDVKLDADRVPMPDLH